MRMGQIQARVAERNQRHRRAAVCNDEMSLPVAEPAVAERGLVDGAFDLRGGGRRVVAAHRSNSRSNSAAETGSNRFGQAEGLSASTNRGDLRRGNVVSRSDCGNAGKQRR